MIHDVPVAGSVAGPVGEKKSGSKHPELPQDPKEAMVEAETLMLRAAENLEFEEAAHWRDVLKKLTSEMGI
jgi:excinuclease UvrABC helicase subunit UvrB